MNMGKKKKRKNRRVVKIHEMYDQGKVKAKSCPKCGAGVFMANHKDRYTCGHCGFTRYKQIQK